MRPAAPLLLLFLAATPAIDAQATFPIPLTAERAVSDVVRTGAAGEQANPQAATNGNITLVAWVDGRGGGYSVYAARVDAAGEVLDPLGVRILTDLQSGGDLNAVVWNGEAFVIFMGRRLAFVTPDMAVSVPPPIDTYSFFAATPGPDPRFLYLSDLGRIAVVDKHGLPFARTTISSWSNSGIAAAAGSESGFLVLRSVGTFGRETLVSDRLDRDGSLLSSKPTGLPVGGVVRAVAGSDGFLLVRTAANGVSTYRLNAEGVFTGRSQVLDVASPAALSLVREQDRYLVAWQTNGTNGINGGMDAIAEIGAADDSVVVHRYSDPAGPRGGIALVSNGSTRVLATSVDRPQFGSSFDVLVRQLTPSLLASDPHLVTSSATQQSNVDVAAGVNGFAVSWSEIGPDTNSHIYVRRFSEAGLPQDDAPILAYDLPESFYPPAATIVSNGETYLLGWLAPDGPVIRRLTARSGAWLDPAPVPLEMKGYLHLASNGTDAVAVASGIPERGEPFTARRINLNGPPLTTPVISLRPGQGQYNLIGLSVGSNGSDYLLAWIERIYFPFPYSGIPSKLFARRLRADATVVGATLSLDDDGRDQSDVRIASAAGRYLVTWSGDQEVRGTRVSAEGVVLDRDAAGGGVLLDPGSYFGSTFMLPTRAGNWFALLDFTFTRNQFTFQSQLSLTGVTFDAEIDLNRVFRLPRALPFRNEEPPFPLAVAPRGGVLAFAYTRMADGETGRVPRAVFRLSYIPPRRRATAR